MKDDPEKVTAAIFRSIAQFDNLDVNILMAGIATVLCRVSIASGMKDQQSIDAFTKTLSDIRQKVNEETIGKLH